MGGGVDYRNVGSPISYLLKYPAAERNPARKILQYISLLCKTGVLRPVNPRAMGSTGTLSTRLLAGLFKHCGHIDEYYLNHTTTGSS